MTSCSFKVHRAGRAKYGWGKMSHGLWCVSWRPLLTVVLWKHEWGSVSSSATGDQQLLLTVLFIFFRCLILEKSLLQCSDCSASHVYLSILTLYLFSPLLRRWGGFSLNPFRLISLLTNYTISGLNGVIKNDRSSFATCQHVHYSLLLSLYSMICI